MLEQLYSHKQKNKAELLPHVIIQKLIQNELKNVRPEIMKLLENRGGKLLDITLS